MYFVKDYVAYIRYDCIMCKKHIPVNFCCHNKQRRFRIYDYVPGHYPDHFLPIILCKILVFLIGKGFNWCSVDYPPLCVQELTYCVICYKRLSSASWGTNNNRIIVFYLPNGPNLEII